MDKITATTIADTVAVAIHSLGFTPTASVVLMLMNHHNLAATLRIDARPETPAGLWAEEITHYVHRLDTVTDILLLSFEDEQAMTPTQYRALSAILALTGRPIRHRTADPRRIHHGLRRKPHRQDPLLRGRHLQRGTGTDAGHRKLHEARRRHPALQHRHRGIGTAKVR